jgi:hypothetical protein
VSEHRKKIKAPAPRLEENRQVEIHPTVGTKDTTAGDHVPIGKTRADFREDEFTRTIRQHGKHVVWRKAMLCPCFDMETQRSRLDCEDCNNEGFLYVDPHKIQALMAQFDKRTTLAQKFGIHQEGNVQVTVEPKYRFGYRDSIEMLDSVMPFNELIFKNDRRGRRKRLPANVDVARYRIVHVARMLYKHAGKLVGLEQDVHFKLTPEGWIKWLPAGNDLIPAGSVITLHYDYHPVFLVVSWLHITRDDTSGRKTTPDNPRVIAHPIQAMAKLEFLLDTSAVPSMNEVVDEPTGFGPGGPPDG